MLVQWYIKFVESKELEKGLKELRGVCSPMEGATRSTGQTPWSSWGLDHQPKNTHGGTHGSSHICSRGLHCLASIREAKAQFPSVGECQGREVGNEWVGEGAPL